MWNAFEASPSPHIQFSENWFSQISKYSRRDQLSVISSESQSGIDISVYFDNHVSPFHRWPILAGERKNRVVETKHRLHTSQLLNKIEVDFRLQREQLAHVQETSQEIKKPLQGIKKPLQG